MSRSRRVLAGIGCFVFLALLLSGVSLAGKTGGYFGTDYDLGGATVTIVTWDGSSIPSQFLEGGSAAGWIQEAEKLFNCKIVFDGADYTNYAEWCLTRYMAGDSVNDIWQVSNRIGYFGPLAKGALLPLDEVVGEGYFDRLSQEARLTADLLSYKGRRYVFSPSTDIPEDIVVPNQLTTVMYYNKTLILNEGLQDPYELYKAGEWTWAEFDRYVKRLTRDTNADGEVDQYGMTLTLDWLAVKFARANGAVDVKFDENGRAAFGFDDDAAKNAAEQLGRWHLIDKVMHPSWDQTGAFMGGNVGFLLYPLWQYQSIANNAAFQFGILPIPMGPNVDRYVYPLQSVGGWALPANVKNPEALMALLEYLYRGDDETMYEDADAALSMYASRQDMEVALESALTWEGEVEGLFSDEGYPELRDAIRRTMDDLCWSSKAFSEVVNARKPVIQGYLDDLFNQ